MFISNIVKGLLKSSVGNNMQNEEEDVLRVKESLSELGNFEDDNAGGIMTRQLDTAIKDFQADKNLKVDGILRPAGETAAAVLKNLEEIDTKRLEGFRRVVERNNSISSPMRTFLSSNEDGEEGEEENDPEEEETPPVPPRKPTPPADDPGEEDPGEEDPGEKEKEEKCRQLKNDLRIARIRLDGAESDLRRKTEESNPALEEWRQAERDFIRISAEATSKVMLSASKGVFGMAGTVIAGGVKIPEVIEAEKKVEEAKQRFESIRAEIEFLNGEIESLIAERESIEAEMASLGCS